MKWWVENTKNLDHTLRTSTILLDREGVDRAGEDHEDRYEDVEGGEGVLIVTDLDGDAVSGGEKHVGENGSQSTAYSVHTIVLSSVLS